MLDVILLFLFMVRISDIGFNHKIVILFNLQGGQFQDSLYISSDMISLQFKSPQDLRIQINDNFYRRRQELEYE